MSNTHKREILYLIRGLLGSSKTTLAHVLTPHSIAADDYPGVYADGKFHSELVPIAHAWCKQEVERMMHKGLSL